MDRKSVVQFCERVAALQSSRDVVQSYMVAGEYELVQDAIDATILRWARELTAPVVGSPRVEELQRAARSVRDLLVAWLNSSDGDFAVLEVKVVEVGKMVNLLAQALDAMELEG